MVHIINPRALLAVILLSTLLLAGCSGTLGEDPGQKANDAIAEANRSIEKHNELFGQARDTYADVKEDIESGQEPSQEERDRITRAKDDLQEARGNLEDARNSLNGVSDLEGVDPAVERYAGLLSEAMDAQLAAEAKEIEFYGILEEDPALENNRDRAIDLLEEVGNGYEEAEQSYAEARELANNNPEVIAGG
jgi:septal ring factor EnvC (AmiA/AmiB activator)